MTPVARKTLLGGLRGFGAGYLLLESSWVILPSQESNVGQVVDALAVALILISAVRAARPSRPAWVLAIPASGALVAALMVTAESIQPLNVVPESLFMGAMFIPWLVVAWGAVGCLVTQGIWSKAPTALSLGIGVALGGVVFLVRGAILQFDVESWGLSTMVSLPILIGATLGSYLAAYVWLRRVGGGAAYVSGEERPRE